MSTIAYSGPLTIQEGGIVVEHGTGASVAGAVTINAPSGVITTETLNTAAGSFTDITLTNSFITATSVITIGCGTWTGPGVTDNDFPHVNVQTPGSGSVVFRIYNNSAGTPLNGTLKINFLIV